MSIMKPILWIGLLALLVGLGLGWTIGRAPLHQQIAEAEASTAKENLRASVRNLERLQQAQAEGDALTAKLLARQTEIDKLKQEKRNDVAKNTTGRPCLAGPALRLLDGATGLRISSGVPQAASLPAAEGGTVATDTDVSNWAIDVGAGYETCRQRLGALIDWHEDKR